MYIYRDIDIYVYIYISPLSLSLRRLSFAGMLFRNKKQQAGGHMADLKLPGLPMRKTQCRIPALGPISTNWGNWGNA